MNTVRNISPSPSTKLTRLLQSVKQSSGSRGSRCLRGSSFSCSLAQGPSCSTVLVSFEHCRASRVKPRLRSTEAGLGAPRPVHCGAPGERQLQQRRAHGTPRKVASSIRHDHPLGAPQGRRGSSREGGTRPHCACSPASCRLTIADLAPKPMPESLLCNDRCPILFYFHSISLKSMKSRPKKVWICCRI